jgi:hypothetical protein
VKRRSMKLGGEDHRRVVAEVWRRLQSLEYGSGSSAREAGGTNGAGPRAHALREVWEVVPRQRVAHGHCTFRARLPSAECYSEAGEFMIVRRLEYRAP